MSLSRSVPRSLSRRVVLALALLAALALAAPAPSARAQGGVAFTLNQRIVTLAQGQSFTFTGSLVNNTGVALTIKDISGLFDPTLSYDFTSYTFPNLAVGQTYTGALFTLTTTTGATGLGGSSNPTPPGTYTSNPTLFDFTDPAGATVPSNTQQFTLIVTPAVPEASTTASFGLLLALGMGGLVVAAKRRKAAL